MSPFHFYCVLIATASDTHTDTMIHTWYANDTYNASDAHTLTNNKQQVQLVTDVTRFSSLVRLMLFWSHDMNWSVPCASSERWCLSGARASLAIWSHKVHVGSQEKRKVIITLREDCSFWWIAYLKEMQNFLLEVLWFRSSYFTKVIPKVNSLHLSPSPLDWEEGAVSESQDIACGVPSVSQ